MKTIKQINKRYSIVQFKNGFYGIRDKKSAFPSKVIIAGCDTPERAFKALAFCRYDIQTAV